ncbi:hypothetical protein TRIUR3_21216 [Triticum urartu]|uniref:KIB1-4 beta-propeller domain-containing protein n=1 Tax=Triticum urartu TaxID=4572 RepID=M7YSL4_TRIUA|nr:hypothetical protein TRIUR3_21216 [Triticum urartu]
MAAVLAGPARRRPGRGVMVLNMGSDQQPPRLHMVADRSKSFYFNPMAHSLHLADNGGELMLVHRTLCHDTKYGRRYDVYRVDLEAGVLVPVKCFNGRAVFMGMGRTISVSAQNPFPCVASDTIYMGPDCDVKIQGYNIADGRRCDLIGAVMDLLGPSPSAPGMFGIHSDRTWIRSRKEVFLMNLVTLLLMAYYCREVGNKRRGMALNLEEDE